MPDQSTIKAFADALAKASKADARTGDDDASDTFRRAADYGAADREAYAQSRAAPSYGGMSDSQAAALTHWAQQAQAAQQTMYAAPVRQQAPDPRDAAMMQWARDQQARMAAMYGSPSAVPMQHPAYSPPAQPSPTPPYRAAVQAKVDEDPYAYSGPSMPFRYGGM